ncbi:MAG: NAD(P)H-dependent oxidoreductase [Actinomycetota bacterium]
MTDTGPDCLVVHAHPDPASYSAALRDRAVAALERNGHTVAVIDLYHPGYRPAMSADEHEHYYSIGLDHPDAATAEHIRLLRSARTIVFVYPTWWSGLPAVMKGWLDRTLLPEVAFKLSPGAGGKDVVRPGLDHVTRLVGITTYGSARNEVRLLGDAGRRTITRTVRLVCARRCRTTWLGLHRLDTSTPAERSRFLEEVDATLGRL